MINVGHINRPPYNIFPLGQACSGIHPSPTIPKAILLLYAPFIKLKYSDQTQTLNYYQKKQYRENFLFPKYRVEKEIKKHNSIYCNPTMTN